MEIDEVIAAHKARIPELSHSEALDVIAASEEAGDTAHLMQVVARYLTCADLREILRTSRGARPALICALAQYEREIANLDAVPAPLETIEDASRCRRQLVPIMRRTPSRPWSALSAQERVAWTPMTPEERAEVAEWMSSLAGVARTKAYYPHSQANEAAAILQAECMLVRPDVWAMSKWPADRRAFDAMDR